MSKFGSPRYWVKTELRNQQRARLSKAAITRYKERYERLWAIYHHLYDNWCETVGELMTDKQYEKFVKLNSDFCAFDKVLCTEHDYTQAGLSRLSTKLKRFAIFILQSSKEYGLLPEGSKIEFVANHKTINLNDDILYYLGS